LVLALVASACSGGSHSAGSAAVPQAKATGAAGKAQLTLKLTLPARTSSSARRLPKYVSAATQGAAVIITANSTTVTDTYTLEPGTSPCASASNGASQCTLTAQLPGVGATSITVNLYDQPAATGVPSGAALLSTGTITTTIAEGASNVTVPVVLSGVVNGVMAGSTGTLPTGGTAGTTTFTLEPTDPDANIILAADGVVNTSGSAVTFTLIAPPAITGITIADVSSGSGSASTLNNVKAGDVIAVSSTTSTPSVLGIPIEAEIGGIPVAILTIPATSIGTRTLNSIASLSSVLEIAGVPPWASMPDLPAGDGFVVLYDESAGGEVKGLASDGSQIGFTCSSGNSGVFIQHVAMGPGERVDLGTSYGTGQGVLLTVGQADVSGTPNCDVVNSNQSADGAGSILDVANDGTNVAAVFSPGTPSIGLSTGASLPSLGSTSNNLNPTAFSLAMWYGQYVAGGNNGQGGTSGLVYISPQQNVVTASGVSPVAVAVDGAGHAYFLDSSGTLQACSLGSTIVITATLAVSGASSDHRAVTVGPDGLVYVATANGLLAFDPATTNTAMIGTTALKEVQASGDGYIYGLGSDGATILRYP